MDSFDMADTGEHPPSAGRSRGSYLFAALIVALVAGLIWRGGNSRPAIDPASVLTPGSAEGFNLLFVTFDTTRPDHLGCYGYELAKTPTIDGLAARGMLCEDAVTSVPLTLPSHAVMMTGKYPPAIGVHDNQHVLAEAHTTLAEVLADQGYDTAAFVSAFVLDERFGLAQGFDVYDFQVDADGRQAPDSLTSERRGDAVTSSAIKWLEQRSDSASTNPFFMWVHYFDPHHPYDSPIGDLPQYTERPGGAYDAEIAFADLQLKRLVEAFDKQGLTDSTLIVFATDHGEGFYEHEEAYHGIFLYETTLRVAIVFSNPKLFREPYRIGDRVVGTVDLMPTVLELLGIPIQNDLDGRSIRAPLRPDRTVYIETEFPLANSCAALYGLRRNRDKYISAPDSEFYDLMRDPNETKNLFETQPEQIKELRDQLVEMRAAWSGNAVESQLPTPQPGDIDRLGALGYVESTAHGENLRDPKDQIHVINKMTDVLFLIAKGKYEEAVRLAEEVEQESECWDAPSRQQAIAYSKLGKPERAAEVLQKYAKNCPSAKAFFDYAKALFIVKRYDESLRQLSESIHRDPKLGIAHMLRGDVYMHQQRYRDALAAYQEAKRIDAERLGPDIVIRLKQARDAADAATHP